MSADGAIPTIGELTAKVRELNRAIRALETELARAGETAADAEAVYRQSLAEAIKRLRSEGRSATESDSVARGEVAALSRDRDLWGYRVRLLYERIEDRRGERASLHRLLDVVGAGGAENTPDGTYGGAR